MSTTTTTTTTAKVAKYNDAAAKSLGILAVTETGMREAWNASQQQRAVVDFSAYALSQGWSGKARTGRDIALLLGTSPGNVSALTRAGAILNRAGSSAGSIASLAVSLCQNTNALDTASLDSLSGVKLRDAVKAMSRAALDAKKNANNKRAARPTSGKGKGKGTTKGTTTVDVKDVTNAGRVASALVILGSVTRDANDDSRARILADVKACRAALDDIESAYRDALDDSAPGSVVTPATPKARKPRASKASQGAAAAKADAKV